MHYQIIVSAEKSKNISNISAEQTLPVKFKCQKCNCVYPNIITLSLDSLVRDNQYHQKSNIIVKCKTKGCDNRIDFTIKPPTNEKLDCESNLVYKSSNLVQIKGKKELQPKEEDTDEYNDKSTKIDTKHVMFNNNVSIIGVDNYYDCHVVSEVYCFGGEILEIPLNEFYVEDTHNNVIKATFTGGSWVLLDNEIEEDAFVISSLKVIINEVKA